MLQKFLQIIPQFVPEEVDQGIPTEIWRIVLEMAGLLRISSRSIVFIVYT